MTNLLSAAVLITCFVIFSVESDKSISETLLFGKGTKRDPGPSCAPSHRRGLHRGAGTVPSPAGSVQRPVARS